MKHTELHILHGQSRVGSLIYDHLKDRISLAYDHAWRFSSETFPISLSLPLAEETHPDEKVRPYLQNLLPDNAAVLDAWGKRFQVSPRNPFNLIKNVGEDCAGALQFVRPERLDLILSGSLDALIPLSDSDLLRRFADLKLQSRSIPIQLDGRFSLAGAQTKDALHLKDGRWFVPTGRIPSTHILKPQLETFDSHSLNEHFCLLLASNMGLSSACSNILEIGGETVLCVKRYDRIEDRAGNFIRIHQEDTCQALGKDPGMKYQSDGGPSASSIIGLLDERSDQSSDISFFVSALALNWVLVGTDAHSKNYSFLHRPGSVFEMAPLYDIASYLPYQTDPKSTKVKLAMKLGNSYRIHRINSSNWKALAMESNLPPDEILNTVRVTLDRLLSSLEPTRDEVAKTHNTPFLHTLTDLISQRARHCADLLI